MTKKKCIELICLSLKKAPSEDKLQTLERIDVLHSRIIPIMSEEEGTQIFCEVETAVLFRAIISILAGIELDMFSYDGNLEISRCINEEGMLNISEFLRIFFRIDEEEGLVTWA